jgi:hypothetical protein
MATPPPAPPRDEFTLDPRQREIRELLQLIGPEPVDYFSDCCRIMAGVAGVRAQTHLAAHLLREIEGRLHEVLDPMLPREAKNRIKAAGKDEESHRAKIEQAAQILSLDDSTREQWVEYALPLHKFAHRYSLAGARDVAEFRDHFDNGQSVLLAVLRRFQTIYVEARPVLAELAATRKPSEGHLKRLRRRVPHSTVALGEFFTLATLDWFPLLRAAGYFDDPPPLEVDEEGRVAYVEWPAGRFLVRAAAVDELQPQVVEILNALETNNPEARDSTVEAALAMPAALAAQLAPKIAGYIRDAEFWWAPRHAEELVVQLVDGDEIATAVELTEPLLAAAPRTADWRMRHAFADLVPKLFPRAGIDGIALLRDLLVTELTAEGREGVNDLSTIWRSEIGGGPDISRRDLLVTALANAADAVGSADTGRLREAVETLAVAPQAIFTRIALHLLARHADHELAAEWLASEDVFRTHSFEREYAELAERSFASVPLDVQERIFEWIAAGPTRRPRDLRQEEQGEFDDRWRRDKLRLLPELPPEWQERYDELVARFGEPDDPRARRERAVWSGTRSPKSKEELIELGNAEMFEFLDSWQPNSDWRGPSVEGLADALRDAAAEAPERFAELLPQLAEREPTYARSVVNGLEQVVRNGGVIPWQSVLEFARAILGLPAELEGRDAAGDDVDPGWERSRLGIAQLIVYGLERATIPRELADDVWAVVSALSEDEDPTVDLENQREGEHTEPALLTFSSVPGVALHAVIKFAWWLRSAGDGDADERHLPENVREVLDRHLDPTREQTRTVHAVLGRHLNQLYFLDPEWTTDELPLIFPDNPEQTARREAAWRGFIDGNNFWTGSWNVLEPYYRHAVEALASEGLAEEDVSFLDMTGRLLGHILSAYVNDAVELSDDSILGRLFAVAPLKLRATFIELIGTDLSGDHEVSEATQAKLQRLWDWRSDRVLAGENVSELAGFAWWFGSGKIPVRWSLEQLIRVLEAGAGVSFDYVVTQRLVELIDIELPLVVRVVSLLVERAYTPHMILSGREEIRRVLRAALGSGDDELIAEARATISRLYALRHTEFNDLLD